jgi:hypothetical protein
VHHPGPYISLVVVTRHDTSPGLFNTKFRLNFGPNTNRPEEEGPTDLSIGRSSLCNMVLDYRTVSTVHAKLIFKNGEFFVQDTHSSNGTMVYLQGPLPLVNNQVVRLRMGRSTLALQVTSCPLPSPPCHATHPHNSSSLLRPYPTLSSQAKRSISASIRGTFQRAPLSTPCTASLSQLQHIMSLAPPYIPRSIRQVDQTNPDSTDVSPSPPGPTGLTAGAAAAAGEAVPLIATTAGAASREVGEAAGEGGIFRITDVNSWLSNLQNQAISNVSRAHAATSAEREGQSREEREDHDETSPRRRTSNSAFMNSPPVAVSASAAAAPSVSRVMEFSSPPLPLNVLSTDQSENAGIDGPIVLGGDRVSVNGSSRPNSGRPLSAVSISSSPADRTTIPSVRLPSPSLVASPLTPWILLCLLSLVESSGDFVFSS